MVSELSWHEDGNGGLRRMATLYELSAAYAAMVESYEAVEREEDREYILNALAEIDSDLSAKAEAYARIIRNKSAEAEALKAEEDRLRDKRKNAENMVERMKGALLDSMKLTGTTELVTSIGKWRTQLNPWTADVLDVDAIPAEYHIKQPDKIDKRAIIEHFKQTGEILDGVEVRRETGLRFR